MADFNPFAALAPITPEGLSASRAATFEEQSQGQSFWAREAGRAGLAARDRALQSGIALSREDERAITTQSLMQGAQRRLADLVKSGAVSPMDAQEQVIRETMSGFMSAGDYNAAQSLLPALNQIQTYKLEQAKLTEETNTERSTQVKNLTDAGATSAKLPFEQAKLRREAGFTLNQGETRFDENGNPIASVAPKPEKDTSVATPAQVQSLRKEFNQLPSVKAYKQALPQIKSAESAPETAYGDIDMIYAVGKIMDPDSVVREGELALVIAANSPLARILGTTEFVLDKGGRLNPKARRQILEMLKGRISAYQQAYKMDYDQFSEYARERAVDPFLVVGNPLDSAYGATSDPAAPANDGDWTTLPNGVRIREKP